MTKANEKARHEAILVLEKYLSGDVPATKVLSCLPDYGEDELLESIVNSFSEPLRDTGCSSWEVFTKICINALKENWSVEKFDNELE
jgi:hypothetical protein